ncbi:MAG: hypothetical protein QM803_02260 [Rhodocyclaceae bacterium]
MSWSSKILGDGVEALLPLRALQSEFEVHWHRAGCPAGATLYVLHAQTGLHCQVTVYFSPAASDIASALDATPCAPPPSQDRLERLAGA